MDMPSESVIDLLKQTSIFSKMNFKQLWRIAGITQFKQYKAGDILLFEEGKAMGCFMIISGRVDIIKNYRMVNEVIIAHLISGEIIGELSMIDGLPHTASAIAIDEVSCLMISSWDFKEQMIAYPEIALNLLPILTNRLRHMLDQLDRK